MNILGISCYYHDAAACLLKDGKIVAAAEEERFSRKKHDFGFPEKAIQYCLHAAGLSTQDIDYVGFYEKPLLKFERLLEQHLEMFPRSFMAFQKAMPDWMVTKLRIPSKIRKKLKYKGQILFIEHHLSHAASAFLVSPFKEAAILTTDGVGEWATTTYGYGKGNDVTLLKEIKFPHSLGLLYSTVTAHLGFSVNNSEYKVMGLAAYGKPKYYEQLKKVIDIKDDGSYFLDMDYFDYHYKLTMPSKKFVDEFGSIRKPESEVKQQHKDMAASVQKITEEAIFKMLNHVYKETKLKNLCMAGGVALNTVANGKIPKETPFENIYIQPAASDAGGCVGVASYIYHTILGKKRDYVMDSLYLGPRYSTDYVRDFLKKKKIQHTEFKDDTELITKTAQLIAEDNVIGWFQGRMEWGPRALGSRSILSNATNPEMQAILNLKVKHREKFRPFAPVVTLEDSNTYFENDRPVPFMLFVFPVKEDKRSMIPSVVHVDGSGRLQTITKEQNARYYGVIKEFEKLKGVPILVNTSFNIRGEPIVCKPEEAYRCMMGTGIDYLVMGRFLIARKNNQHRMHLASQRT